MWAPETALAKTNDPAPCSIYREMAAGWNKWLVARLRHSNPGRTIFLMWFCCVRGSFVPGPSTLNTGAFSQISWDPLALRLSRQVCVGRRTEPSRGPQAWARSCVGVQVLWVPGLEEPKCSEKPCAGEDRRGRHWKQGQQYTQTSPVLTVSTIATEKTKTPGCRDMLQIQALEGRKQEIYLELSKNYVFAYSYKGK